MYQPNSCTDLFFPSPPPQDVVDFEDFQDFTSPNPSYPFLQRCISSFFFHQHKQIGVGSMRKVFSTGDIHNFSCDRSIPPPAESVQLDHQQFTHCGGSVSYSAGRVGRYNAEERRGRIERYRNKRNLRNFQKKITYACRKTLADRRPRVHGRFARIVNHEDQRPPQEEEGLTPSMRTTTEDEDYCSCDGELWSNFVDALINVNNLLS